MLEEKLKRTELSEMGEFRLIDHLTEDIKIVNKETIKGVGDDAAVIDNGNYVTLVSTDILTEGIHFDLTYTPLKHLGYKAAVVNFSDIAAMNGTPKQITVSIAVSNRFSVEALDEFYDGLKIACKKYNVDLVGGDTTSSLKGLFISITVVGIAKKDDVVYRNTAKANDLICVTGDLGGAFMGLKLLEREKEVFKADPGIQPDLEGYDYIVGRQLKPEARMDIIKIFKDLKVKPTSMIDISDGLASEIMHICKDSDVGCNVYLDKIPIDPTTNNMAVDFNMAATVAALNGGEDYELLFTISQDNYEKIKTVKEITVIGYITEARDNCYLVANDNSLIPIKAQGWNSFPE
ncbi:MAG: thiamine-phosphate kinase [Bacteroidota bacterium]|nr:thiamine-phosphate kinase [Bacteroidota bacterium]